MFLFEIFLIITLLAYSIICYTLSSGFKRTRFDSNFWGYSTLFTLVWHLLLRIDFKPCDFQTKLKISCTFLSQFTPQVRTEAHVKLFTAFIKFLLYFYWILRAFYIPSIWTYILKSLCFEACRRESTVTCLYYKQTKEPTWICCL